MFTTVQIHLLASIHTESRDSVAKLWGSNVALSLTIGVNLGKLLKTILCLLLL